MAEVTSESDSNSANPADAIDIAAALSGDGEGYRRLVARYQVEIAQQMRRFSRDPGVRDDLTHEVFVEAYMSLRSFQGTSPWIHWLRRIAIRVGYRYWTNQRGRSREVPISDENWKQLRGELDADLDATDAADLVYSLLARLTPSDRLVLTLLYLDGCTMEVAAQRAGWTVVGTKVRAFRARNRLRTMMAKESNGH